MKIFEFKHAPGQVSLLDLESIQWIHPLYYRETPHYATEYTGQFYEGSPLVRVEKTRTTLNWANWEGRFSLTLMLQENDRVIAKSGSASSLISLDGLSSKDQDILKTYYKGGELSREQLQAAADVFNAREDKFMEGHDFCYEYERLVKAWRELPDRAQSVQIVR